jgi:choice-of-anchor B domain-containing protein
LLTSIGEVSVVRLVAVPQCASCRAIIFSFLLSPSVLIAQNGVTFVDSLNRPHGVSPQNTRFSSCWGWVSPDGREYALLGTYTGTAIIDLNVSPIQEIAFIPGNTAGYAYREFKTYKNYAYIVSEGGRGVQIVDLSQLPDTAVLVSEFNYINGTKNILRSHTVTLADGYLYLNGSANWSPGGVVIFSLHNDPANPQYAGQYQPEYIHDSYVRNDTLYGAAINFSGGLYIVDIHDKASPQLIRKVTYAGSGTHHAWASINGRYAFTTDEIGSTPSNLKIWDQQNLGSGPPYTPAASYRASPADLIHNVHGRGNYAYVSHYTAGMRVVDVHDPLTPAEVGSYDSYPGPGGNFDGCWAVYPYFPSGRWIGSDMQTGLYVLRFDGLLPRIRSPLLLPEDGDTVVPPSPVTFRWRQAASQQEDPHYYELHIVGPGIDTLFATRDTSCLVSVLPGFQNGQTYSWHVWIRDEYTSVASQDTFQFVYGAGAVGVTAPGLNPGKFHLAQNYPNPFNPRTSIRFDVGSAGRVTVNVFNVLGHVVKTLVDDIRHAGQHEVSFDAMYLPSGVYVYVLTAASGFREARKMILAK